MSKTVSPNELLEQLESIDIEVPDNGVKIATTDIEQQLNLNALAIGLGLENCQYTPDKFPGFVYFPGEYDDTVVVIFGHGIFFVAGAANVEVQEVVDTVINRLKHLGMVDETAPAEVVNSPAKIQVPPEYNRSHELEKSESQTSCPSCGSELSDEENYCAECGEELARYCPSCSRELSNEENYCPECGTDLSN